MFLTLTLSGWAGLDTWYYGCRVARNCHPDELWDTYFTDSQRVGKFRKNYGEPDIVQVRQIFNDSLQAREWEHKVLQRLDVIHKNNWLNQSYGKKPIRVKH